MSDEIKVGQKWEGVHGRIGEVRFITGGNIFFEFDDGSNGMCNEAALRRFFTLIPDTVLVELSVEVVERITERDQARAALAARHTDSHWCGDGSAGRSFYMKHDLCDAHTQATRVLALATLYVEALDEQLTINERLETSTERLSPDLVPHLLEWAARWLDLTDKILSMVHDEDQPELTKELNEIAKRNPNTPMAQDDLRAIGVEYVRLCRELAEAQAQIKEME
jgi:hypothetical protein